MGAVEVRGPRVRNGRPNYGARFSSSLAPELSSVSSAVSPAAVDFAGFSGVSAAESGVPLPSVRLATLSASVDASVDLHFSQPSPVAHLAHASPWARDVSVCREVSVSEAASVWASEPPAGADCQHPPPQPAVSLAGVSEDPLLAFWKNSLEQPAIRLRPKPNAIHVVS